MFDEITKKWSKLTNDGPVWKYGHSMACYYDYVFVFGGIFVDGKYSGELAVYDIVHRKWTVIIDSRYSHEMMHRQFEGGIPEPRAFAQFTLFPDFGALIMSGGKLEDGSVAQDLWQLDLDAALDAIENPTKFEPKNLWKYLSG